MNPKEKLKLLAEYEELVKKEAELKAKMLPLKAKENYAAYVEYAHLYDAEFKLAPFQRYICDCIDKLLNNELLNEQGNPYKGICLSQPPQTGKSRCVTETLPSYFLGKNPLKHVIEVSYSGDFAQKFGRRNIEKINDFGKQLFGIEMSQDKKASDEFELVRTRGGMISRGIEGQITVNPADLIIVDDPYKTMSEADSPSWQKTVMDVWLSAIKMRASAKCKFIVVHTRWNEDDLIGYLTSTEPDKWFEINFPMIAEQYEPVTGRQIGDPLLPEAGKTKEWAESEKESFLRDPESGGVRVWNASYQQRPSSLEGNMIKRDCWKRFTLTLAMQERGYFPVKVQSWDCALKDTSDPVAGGVWGKRGANYYMIDHKGGRMDIVQTMNGIVDWDKKHPDAMAKLIEDKANGPAAMRILRDKISGLIPVNPGTKSKAERVSMVLPLWQAGNVYIPDRIETKPGIFEPCLWANDIIEQCAAFKPDKKVQRDDEVDQTSQALNWLYFQTANVPETEQHYNFDFERPQSDNSYFGSTPGEDYFSGGY
jgi:predicted phage terminase large subunit-like protein